MTPSGVQQATIVYRDLLALAPTGPLAGQQLARALRAAVDAKIDLQHFFYIYLGHSV